MLRIRTLWTNYAGRMLVRGLFLCVSMPASRILRIDNMKGVIDRISTFVEGGNWDEVKSHAIKLKYMQGIDAAAEAWPNTVHDH